MDTKESLKILNRFVELGVRKSTLEKTIGLPMNSLASVLNGKKDFPKAWEAKVEKFISENTSPPIPEPMATILVKVDEWQWLKRQEQKFGKVEEYELRIAELEDEIKKIVENNNKPENKKRILEERNTVVDHSKHDKAQPSTQIMEEPMFKKPVDKYVEHRNNITYSDSKKELVANVVAMKKEMFLNNKQKSALEDYAKQVMEEKGFIYND